MLKNNVLKQKVPTHLAFIIMLGLSFLVAWLSVYTGDKIVYNARKSPTFNFQKRFHKEITQKKSVEENKTEGNLINK